MKSVKKEVSFRRKLMTAVLSVTLPLIALLLFSNLYSTQAFNRKIADSNMRTMDYRAGRMEGRLRLCERFSHRVDGERRLPHAVGR